MLTTRSFAAAVFIVGQGFEPVSVNGKTGYFTFPKDAQQAFLRYQRIAQHLGDKQIEAAQIAAQERIDGTR
jgi:hypothetical protein